MGISFSSTLLLTILLAIGLFFFLRAASKDRTTDVQIQSPLPPLEVVQGLTLWLEDRGWVNEGGDLERKLLRFHGKVNYSQTLLVLLSFLGALGSGCLGLVIRQLYTNLEWWPLLIALVGGPAAGFAYKKRAQRTEYLEFRLISSEEKVGSTLKVRAHRDELIAMELELSKTLKLASDGKLLSSPI